MEQTPRTPYPADVTDEEWAFVVPYVILMTLEAPQRAHDLREVVNALRWIVRAGAPWRLLPTDFPPWPVVDRQTRRWIDAGCFEALTHDRRALLRLASGRAPQPTAAVVDSRTVQATPESGHRAGGDGAKRRTGTTTHVAGDTRGHLLALHVSPASAQDRTQVDLLAAAVQEATGASVERGDVDHGDTGEQPAADAAASGMRLEVVKVPDVTTGVVLLPKRWVVERTFAGLPRARRLARDDERLPRGAVGLHVAAFLSLLITRAVALLSQVGNSL